MYLANVRGPVRQPEADDAARSFTGSLPEEGSGTLTVVRQLLEPGVSERRRFGNPAAPTSCGVSSRVRPGRDRARPRSHSPRGEALPPDAASRKSCPQRYTTTVAVSRSRVIGD